MVINLLILIAGLVSIKTLNVRQYPRSDIAVVDGQNRLYRSERRSRSRLHYHAAGASHRQARTGLTTLSLRAPRA